MEHKEQEVFSEGLEVGSVSVKWTRVLPSGELLTDMVRHDGNPLEKVREILSRYSTTGKVKMVVTGQAAKGFFYLPYRSEAECIERALAYLDLRPDLLLSLGGENFSVITLKDGEIRNILPSSKCAAGTGEFIVQQLQRMGLTLEGGIQESLNGKVVNLAARCSVHCKSDATHKLNKGECSRSDIAKTLINDLGEKVYKMVEATCWQSRSILVIGGLALNKPFVEHLRALFRDSNLAVLPESPYFEAFGASLLAAKLPQEEAVFYSAIHYKAVPEAMHMPPLRGADKFLDYRVKSGQVRKVKEGASYIMGIDAGSTTTKAILFDSLTGTIDASCYLRTHGNPEAAVKNCLQELMRQVSGKRINIVQIAATGSGRGIVAVFFENCPSFNEILAHARAAAQEVPDVDTVFEIGGQDSKYISFLSGIPIDYAMNDGCSAGTGSFLEEAISAGMGISVGDISKKAEDSVKPTAFGERCAAFINTDLRNALQQGAQQEDVIAGLVYSIARNYISRLVGVRAIGDKVLFQGGVALNKSVALAIASLTQRSVVVPSYPELMGCVGSCLMTRDMLDEGSLRPRNYDLKELLQGTMEITGTFQCPACKNKCEIKKIAVRKKEYPFGGLCSRYELKKTRIRSENEGQDWIAGRNQLMFEKYGAETLRQPRGRIGIPLALTTYEFYPFYAKFINELGFDVVLSRNLKEGNRKTLGPICYPCEIAHGAVQDLIQQGVDYIFLPPVFAGAGPEHTGHSYICGNAAITPDLVRIVARIGQDKVLQPSLGFSNELTETSLRQLEKLAANLSMNKGFVRKAGQCAFAHYQSFKTEFEQFKKINVNKILAEPTVILAGRPYVICSSEANLALPRKITSRGYNVITVDMIPDFTNRVMPRDGVWYFTRQIINAIRYAKQFSNLYICLVSCFSCVPDASMYHLFRRELAGEVFCYLEIDSHTAHAGFETRIGAFLDIIELNGRKTPENRSNLKFGG